MSIFGTQSLLPLEVRPLPLISPSYSDFHGSQNTTESSPSRIRRWWSGPSHTINIVFFHHMLSWPPPALRGQRLLYKPTQYREFTKVFSKAKALGLPLHHPYDCTIDFLPGTTLLPCRIYPLSLPAQHAMKEYIEEALRQGYICPSTSPASASFFFIEKIQGASDDVLTTEIWTESLSSTSIPYGAASGGHHLHQTRSPHRMQSGEHPRGRWVENGTIGHYKYLVMPYGLSCALSIFQNIINYVRYCLYWWHLDLFIQSWDSQDPRKRGFVMTSPESTVYECRKVWVLCMPSHVPRIYDWHLGCQ